MPATVELDHRGPITYESALKKDANIISQAAHLAAAKEFTQELWDSRRTIEALVRHHLGLADGDACAVQPRDRWIRGGFNLCVLVEARLGVPAAPTGSSCSAARCHISSQRPGTPAAWTRS